MHPLVLSLPRSCRRTCPDRSPEEDERVNGYMLLRMHNIVVGPSCWTYSKNFSDGKRLSVHGYKITYNKHHLFVKRTYSNHLFVAGQVKICYADVRQALSFSKKTPLFQQRVCQPWELEIWARFTNGQPSFSTKPGVWRPETANCKQ
jgi:hypothetical protein